MELDPAAGKIFISSQAKGDGTEREALDLYTAVKAVLTEAPADGPRPPSSQDKAPFFCKSLKIWPITPDFSGEIYDGQAGSGVYSSWRYFQVVLANRLTVAKQVDPLCLYESLRAINPSPYHFLLHTGSLSLVGASPETMLESTDPEPDCLSPTSRVKMRLVAGTYPHLAGPQSSDQTQKLSLDEKEKAEHMMLVDHARNDIGRVATIGSLAVHDLLSVESYRNVHHLVSQVSGDLRVIETLLTALRSCFPICTLTSTRKEL